MKVRTPTSATGNRGFTIVEILVVVAIISVLATVTVPRMYAGRSKSRLRGAARRLLVTAQYARDFATTRRCECRLIIDSDRQRYSMLYQKDPQHNPSEFTLLGTGLGKAQNLGKNLEFGKLRIAPRQGLDPDQPPKEVGYITFDPTGQADAAVLEITDGTNTYSLLIVPYTGYAKLTEGTVSELPNDRIDLDA